MFLQEFRIGGFKAFNETQRLPIKPITLIFGPNSGGKSSLIHALLLAHEAIVNEKLDVHQTQIGGDSVDLGGFANYVHRHERTREVEFGFRLTRAALASESDRVADSEPDVTSRVACADRPYVKGYRIDGRRPGLLFAGTPGKLSLTEINGEPRDHFRVYMTREVSSDEHELESPDFEPGNAQWSGGPTYGEWTRLQDVQAVGKGLVPRKLAGEPEGGESLLGWWQDGKRMAAPWSAPDRLPGYLSYEEWAKRKGFSIQTEAVDLGAIGEPAVTETADEGGWAPPEDPLQKYEAFIKRLRETSKNANAMRAVPFREELNDIVEQVHSRLSNGFGSLKYLGPFRSYPARQLPTPGAYDPNFNATGASAWYRIRADEEVRDAVNSWLGSKYMQTPYELVRGDPEKLELLLTDVHRNLPVSHRDVGIGVSQVLPVLVEAYGSRGATVVIEQPEIHLHPRLQAELGDVFIKAALSERENTFIIETHSEHLILRLLRSIRETSEHTIRSGMTAVKPEDVSVVYVEPTDSGSRVIEMELSEDGQLVTPWPGGFFEEGFRERFGD